MTKRPVGLTWILVFLSMSFLGSAFSMTSSMTASRSFLYFTCSSCCVLTTMASMRTGTSSSYSSVTCVLPSGRRKSTPPIFFLRTAASCRASLCAYSMGAGMSSGVSSVA